ncbi:capsular associated protein [Rhizophlyctis rosea]|nr:capsular associated protein [Rhizophlyctis rosea]
MMIRISRNIKGEAFFNGEHDHNTIPVDSKSTHRMSLSFPFQAQCCWNGMAFLRAAPFLSAEDPILFRSGNLSAGECAASECTLLCNDFQTKGYARTLVVPDVRVAYGWEEYEELVKLEGKHKMKMAQFGNENAGAGAREGERVVWEDPTDKVWCRGMLGVKNSAAPWKQISVPVGKRPTE